MNTPMPPTEPLDAQERELARILRALPAGEPPAALDAAILRAAHDATATQKRRGAARVLASGGALWGIGSAAAAVLALGVAWQMRYGAPQGVITESAPRAQAVSDVAEDEAIAVDLGETRADAPAAAPAAPPPLDLPKQALARKPQEGFFRGEPAPVAAAAPPPAPSAPEPYPADHLDEHVARDATVNSMDVDSVESTTSLAAEQERRKREEVKERAAGFAAKSSMANAAPAPATAAAEADDRAQAGAAALGGVVAQRQDAAPMKPANWLAEVRRLRDAGEIAQARAKLVEFRQAYPNWVIPTDLAPLLSE